MLYAVTTEGGRIRLPRGSRSHPTVAILRRIGIALLIVGVSWAIVLLEQDGYEDQADGHVSVIDGLYYTTVTLTTTGYGDITPVSTQARLVNALVVTPMRLLFVFVLVGTTIQVLTERSREAFRLQRWRHRVKDHVVVIGFGTKGRSAVRELLSRGHRPGDIVVIDPDPAIVDDAGEIGVAAIVGDATKDAVLRQALVERARAVIVATARDDAAVLATLSSRRLAPNASITVAVREAENVDLVEQSGADSVIVSSSSAGRLLGIATDSPSTVHVLEDLLSFGSGLDIVERDVAPAEVGQTLAELRLPVMAVVRGGEVLHYGQAAIGAITAGDRLVYVAVADRA
jgi:voltage-gated potassium channel